MVEGVCVGQSGLATSLQHSRRFPLSPERSTGMQHRKFPLLNTPPHPARHWACRVGWKLAYGWPHPAPYPPQPETLHPQQLLSVFGFQLRLPWPSSQKPVCRAQLWHRRSSHNWPATSSYRPPAMHIVCPHFIAKTGFISGGASLICPWFCSGVS